MELFFYFFWNSGQEQIMDLIVSCFQKLCFAVSYHEIFIYSSLLLHIFTVSLEYSFFSTFFGTQARINKNLKKGEQYTIAVNPGFNVTSFKGKKRLVLSTTSWMGGKNSFLGIAYVVVGSISLVLGLGFLIMDKLKPRKLGDTNYLVWS